MLQINKALAKALWNYANFFFRLKPCLRQSHLRLKTEAIHKAAKGEDLTSRDTLYLALSLTNTHRIHLHKCIRFVDADFQSRRWAVAWIRLEARAEPDGVSCTDLRDYVVVG